MQKSIIKYIVHLEFLLLSIALVLFGILVGKFQWYWLLIGFLAYDISLLAYLVSPTFGRYAYNITHSLVGPSLLMIVYILTNDQNILFIVTTWLLNICVNRALGYGLKEGSDPVATHSGVARLHKSLRRK